MTEVCDNVIISEHEIHAESIHLICLTVQRVSSAYLGRNARKYK